jgi:hypothetical protein
VRGRVHFSWLWLYAGFILWNFLTTERISLSLVLYLSSFLWLSLVTGDLFVNIFLQDKDSFSNSITKFILGVLFVNIFVLLLSIISPFGLTMNWIFLILTISFLWGISGWKQRGKILLTSNITETIFLIISPLAITAWSQDLLRPIEIINGIGVIRAWPDIYFHLAQINAFASSLGGATISDVQMAGATAHFYHIASYLLPATIVSFTGISSLEAYSSFYVPLGLLLSSSAAYSLINSIFGKWPALVSSLALLLLPDAFQQAFGNPFLSYHWLQQIAPAGLYGVAVSSVGFMFLFESCRVQNFKYIFIGFFFIGISTLFKAQIFVATSFVALIYPFLFLEKIKKFPKFIILLILIASFFVVVKISQTMPSVPKLLLNGSGFSDFSSIILGLQFNGFIRDLVFPILSSTGINQILKIIFFIIMLSVCTFGMFIFIYLALLNKLKQSIKPYAWLFPLMVLVVYLIMATSLAMDDHNIGTPEELLHRPFVWAYFVILIWSIAGGYSLIFGDSPPSLALSQGAFIFITICLIGIPLKFGHKISTFNAWGINYQELPLCQVKTANFIKHNSNKFEVVLDSNNDSKFLMSSLSERAIFVMDSGGHRKPIGVQSRLNLVSTLNKSEGLNEVRALMRDNSIKWYVINPGADIKWQSSANEFRVFECGGYSIYKFN